MVSLKFSHLDGHGAPLKGQAEDKEGKLSQHDDGLYSGGGGEVAAVVGLASVNFLEKNLPGWVATTGCNNPVEQAYEGRAEEAGGECIHVDSGVDGSPAPKDP